MKQIFFCLAIAAFPFSIALQAQILVPQSSPYATDANTVLLEHFDGTSTGTANGTVNFTTGVFGQGVHLIDTAWISYNLGALPQGTVEFWANLDNLNNSVGAPGLFGSFYSQFFAGTMYINISPVTGSGSGQIGQPNGGVNIAPFNWNHSPANSAIITPNTWHNYALTWGNAGLRLYIDGTLVSSNSNTGGQNPSTSWWAVGVSGSGANGSPGEGFNGTMDELRISDVQRDFAVVPEPTSGCLFIIGLPFLFGRRTK